MEKSCVEIYGTLLWRTELITDGLELLKLWGHFEKCDIFVHSRNDLLFVFADVLFASITFKSLYTRYV